METGVWGIEKEAPMCYGAEKRPFSASGSVVETFSSVGTDKVSPFL